MLAGRQGAEIGCRLQAPLDVEDIAQIDADGCHAEDHRKGGRYQKESSASPVAMKLFYRAEEPTDHSTMPIIWMLIGQGLMNFGVNAMVQV